MKLHLIEGFARVEFVSRATGGLDNASGVSENNTCTRRFAERVVELLIGQPQEVDVCLLDESSQFTRGNGIIHIGIAVHLEFVALAFVLLGQARHNGNHDQVFTAHTDLFGKIGFSNCTKHLLRRLCR